MQNKLTKEELLEKTKLKIYLFIALRARSEYEVVSRIKTYLRKFKQVENKFKEEIIDEVITDLKEQKLVDDANYTQLLVHEKTSSSKTSNRYSIKNYLAKKGISDELISEHLKSIPQELELENAIKDGQKKVKSLAKYDAKLKKYKLMNFLRSKGYSYEIITTAVDTLLSVK